MILRFAQNAIKQVESLLPNATKSKRSMTALSGALEALHLQAMPDYIRYENYEQTLFLGYVDTLRSSKLNALDMFFEQAGRLSTEEMYSFTEFLYGFIELLQTEVQDQLDQEQIEDDDLSTSEDKAQKMLGDLKGKDDADGGDNAEGTAPKRWKKMPAKPNPESYYRYKS